MTDEEIAVLEVQQQNIAIVLNFIQRVYKINDDFISGDFDKQAQLLGATPEQIDAAKATLALEKLQILTTLKQMAESFLQKG